MADEEETPAEAPAVEEVQMSVLDALKEVSEMSLKTFLFSLYKLLHNPSYLFF